MRLNHTRQFLKWADKNFTNEDLVEDFARYYIVPLQVAEKFILPLGAKILDDAALELLCDPTIVRLPYPTTLLEYSTAGLEVKGYDETPVTTSHRRIVVATERDDDIYVMGIWDAPEHHAWAWSPWFKLGREAFGTLHTGKPAQYSIMAGGKLWEKYRNHPQFEECMVRDMSQEFWALGRFIAAMACKNVGSVTIPSPRKHSKKSAIPFDDYRCLVINGSGESGEGGEIGDRKSPREHLRRGHVRRLANGSMTWVNSAVINAGSGGSIKKHYEVRE